MNRSASRAVGTTFVLCAVLSAPAFATDPGPRILPNGTGDGYAIYATNAYGAFTSSECGGGINADGSTKALGAAEFDPYNPSLPVAYGRGGVMCNSRVYLFSPDGAPLVRQILTETALGLGGPNLPDGTLAAQPIRPSDLVSDEWVGPNDRVRRTRFFPHLFPGLQVDLDQRASCAALTQVYRFTNVGTTPLVFRVTQMADSDLQVFGGSFVTNYGRLDPADPLTSYIYNQAKTVGLMMRSRPDFDSVFEGWRVKLQNSAGYEHYRAQMYYGLPSAYHQTPRCQADPLAVGCPAPSHLNKIFRAATNSNPDSWGIAPQLTTNLESNNDLTGPGGVPDGWSDSVWDVAQSLQSLYVIEPGESREYRTLYEGIPSYCRVQTDAGYDVVVAVAEAASCATTVSLDASRSVVSGGGSGTSTYTWYDVHGQQVATGAVTTVDVVGSGEHRFDLRVCNADGICDIDFVVVVATDEDGECADTDGDGVIDSIDLDDDDDGIADVAEATIDSDGDGLIDSLDLDSDDDNVPDMLEGDDDDGVGVTPREQVVDADHDGRVDHLTRVDDDHNGWDDHFEDDPPSLPDFDGDEVPDVLDDDDDGDAIPTALECPDGRACPSNAGQPDYLDVRRFACSALYSASAGTWLGAGGTTDGTWNVASYTHGAVARDGWQGHLYVITSTGALWRATPGSEAFIGETGLVGVTALTATPEPGTLLAGRPATSTTDLFRVSIADASVTSDGTLPGVIGDITFDRGGNRVYTRMNGTTAQLVGATTVTTAAFVQGLSMRPDGTLVGLTLNGTTLTVSTINPATGALTTVFEPTRVWRPALTPAAPYDLGQCPPNLAPALVPDIVVTPFNTPADIAPLANDSDRDGTLVVGTLTLGAPDVAADVTSDGPTAIIVAPPTNYVGAIGIDYSVADDDGLTRASEIVVLVAPDAQDDVFYRLEGDDPIDFALAPNDNGAGTYTLHSDAPSWVGVSGATLVTGPASSGIFVFGYDLCYATSYVGYEAICDSATVTLIVNARPSLAATTSTTHIEGDPAELDIASIYSDAEGHALDLGSVTFTAPAGCNLSLSQDGTRITATPSIIETCVISISACDTSVTPGCTTSTWTVIVTEPPCGGVPSDELVELCDGTDDNCDGSIDEYFDTDCGPGQVYYAIVEDDAGPVGTIRCWVNGASLDCDREPTAPDELLVYPALLCPAYATHATNATNGGTP